MNSSVTQRARDRIDSYRTRQPEAVRLARYASLAVRVDATLLRALRLALMPASDAGLEADLWFSPLTESFSSQGFVIDRNVANELRQELVAETDLSTQTPLDRCYAITAATHRWWPASLQIEERVTWLALRGPRADDSSPQVEIEALLRQLIRAMLENTARGTEIARWTQRALPRLPQAARETEGALLLAVGAGERLRVPI